MTATTPSTVITDTPASVSISTSTKATKRQIRGSSLLLFGQLVSKSLNFVIQVLIVRFLTKNDYGAFAYALSVAALGQTIATFGLDRAVSRFVSIYHEREDFPKMAGTIVMVVASVLLLGFAVIGGFYALNGFIARTYIQDQLVMSLLLVLIFMTVVDSLDNLMNGMFAVFSRPGAIFFRKYVLGPGLRIGVIILLIVDHSGVRFLAVGYVISGFLAIAIYSVLLVNMMRKIHLFQYFKPSIIQVPAREILAFTIPLLTSDLVYVVMNTVDAILVQHFKGTADVAALRAVQPTAKMNQLVLTSFAMLFTPAAARMFARNDREGINNLYWQNAVWISVISFPIFALTFSLAKPITILLYGARYEQSDIILGLLSFAYYFNAALGQNGLTLKVFGKLRFVVWINAIAAVLNFVVNLVLIPRFGAVGAAFGTFFTLILFNLMKQAGLKMGTGISLFEGSYLKVYLIIAAFSLGLLLLQVVFSPPTVISFALAGIASWLVFRLNHQLLNLEQTFPDLLKIPFLKRILGI